VPTINPPVITLPYEDNPLNGPIYPTFVPKTSDGNEIAGIRLPELTVPLATYTGRALRAGVYANDGCEGSGQYIPFAKTKAERKASGDPRKSVEERYDSIEKYQNEVVRAINKLVKDRFLLCEDTDAIESRLLQAGVNAGILPRKNGPMLPAPDEIKACKEDRDSDDD